MKLVLIDRDGVINRELDGYVTRPQELAIYPNVLKAFALLKSHGVTCVVITNQSVVGRGIITATQLEEIHDYLCKEVRNHGGDIAEIITCTDHPDHATHRRKPSAGMLLEALVTYNATAQNTPFIGDALTDVQAAIAAHCIPYLVKTGKGMGSIASLDAKHSVITCEDMLDAAQKIIENS